MCPRQIDYTEALVQMWFMMVPGIKEKHAIKWDERTAEGHVEDVRTRYWVWYKLARPDLQHLDRAGAVEHHLPKEIYSLSTCSLSALPHEIMDQILSQLDSLSILSLACSCLLCAHRTVSHIRKVILKTSAPWANQTLACLGSYLKTLPPSFLPDGRKHWDTRRHFHGVMCNARRYNWTAIYRYSGYNAPRICSQYKDKQSDYVTAVQQWISMLSGIEQRSGQELLPPSAAIDFMRRLLQIENFYGPLTPLSQELGSIDLDQCRLDHDLPKSIWYLRNLDTGEFIRVVPCTVNYDKIQENDCVTSEEGRLSEPSVNVQTHILGLVDYQSSDLATSKLTVDHILARKTSWLDYRSNQGKHSQEEVLEQQARSWAGHRFDLVTKNMHERELAAQTTKAQEKRRAGEVVLETIWKDVTEESVESVHSQIYPF